MANTIKSLFTLCKFSRMGKAAKGFFEVPVLGLPSTIFAGVTKDLSYTHLHNVDVNLIIDAVKVLGVPLQELIAIGHDEKRRENNGGGSEQSAMADRLIAQGFTTDRKTSMSMAKEFIKSMQDNADIGIEMSTDKFLSLKKKVLLKQGKIVAHNPMAPRLVDNRVNENETEEIVEETIEETTEEATS